MPEKESHPIRNGVIATVVGGILYGMLSSLWPPFTEFLTLVWSLIKQFGRFLVQDNSVPTWVLILLSVLAMVPLVSFVRDIIRRTAALEYLSYTEDKMFGATWRWRWVGNRVSNLWGFCSTCDAELVYDDSSCGFGSYSEIAKTDFHCERCGGSPKASIRGGNKQYALSYVEREIQRLVRTNTFTKS